MKWIIQRTKKIRIVCYRRFKKRIWRKRWTGMRNRSIHSRVLGRETLPIHSSAGPDLSGTNFPPDEQTPVSCLNTAPSKWRDLLITIKMSGAKQGITKAINPNQSWLIQRPIRHKEHLCTEGRQDRSNTRRLRNLRMNTISRSPKYIPSSLNIRDSWLLQNRSLRSKSLRKKAIGNRLSWATKHPRIKWRMK